MNSTLRSWHEKGYFNYSLIPFVVLGLVIAHQIYLNIPQKDDRPSFTIGGVSEGNVGDLSVVFSVDDENGKVGDEFALEFTLTNHGEADYVQRIGRARAQPGEDFTEIKVWDPAAFNPDSGEMEPLGVGRYWLSGVWLGKPFLESGKILLTIG